MSPAGAMADERHIAGSTGKAAGPETLVELDDVAVTLGGAPVLRDIRLSMGKGEIYGLLGPNGAGKTTTISVIAGLLAPERGRVRVAGLNPIADRTRLHARIGVLPEQIGFYDWMTAEEYLRFFSRLYGRDLDGADAGRRLKQVGLAPRQRQRIGTFSRGMKQRLALARALINDPMLLILDEPTNGLDPRGRRDVHDILRDLAAHRDVGIVMCTHLLEDVDRICRRIGIISNGVTVAEGPIAELLEIDAGRTRFRLHLAAPPPDPRVPPHAHVVGHDGNCYVVDLDPAISPDAVWRDLLFMGWPVTEIERAGGGLEELYLDVTEGRAS